MTCLAIGIAVPTLAAAVEANAATTDSTASLTTTVQTLPATGDALTMRFTARNTSSSTIDVLSRDLPRARQSAAVLTVTRDGVPVPYRGKMVKYGAPTAADYTRIPAAGTYAVTMDLAADYDLSTPGTYTVALASTQVHVRRGATATPADTVPVRVGRGTVRTNTGIRGSAVPSDLSAAPTTTERIPTVTGFAVTVVYRGCSSSQKTAVKQAVSDAAQFSANANTWVASHPSGGGVYATWFGAYNSSRFAHVSSEYSHVSSELTSKTVTLDCATGANDSAYAYVYPDAPYTIYLCQAYWPAPARGYDSKAGTLIHESSHFTVNGGTDDHVYGRTAAKQLAKSNPANAVDNADNYEYFTESL
jgi:peptidyl-Lys metalloendopeptidase